MSTPIDIFDREDIQAIIRDKCLLGEKGVGTVVLSPQKSGKSHLLEYIYKNRPSQTNTLYCWIGVDDLLKRVRPGEELSDEVFLRYFLSQLHDELGDYLGRERKREADERANLERYESQLNAVFVSDANFQKLLEAKIAFTKDYLRSLEVLQTYKDRIAELLAENTHYTFVLYEFLDDLLDKLKRMKKPVVIFIDDVNKIVGNHAFTRTLLSLLRGASSDGKLVPLLSTPLQLMDPSLHERERGDQTRSLFNDVKVEVLNSFTDDQALKFLHWPEPPHLPFDRQEQEYILDLAGCSPYFLKEVRERFLRTRPVPDARKRFELEVGQALAAALETIWNRCTQPQREAIRQVQNDQARAQDVDLGPATCFARPRGFAKVFETFLDNKSLDEPEVVAAAAPAFTVFPTALCHADPDSARPLVTITLRNPTKRKVRVRLQCELEGFSRSKPKLVEIPAGRQIDESLRITLISPSAESLKNPEPTQIHWKAELNPGAGAVLIAEDTFIVRVLAVDQFVFANKDEVEGKLLNCAWLIAAWVDAEDKGVQEVARKAIQEAQKTIGQVSGYPNSTGPETENVVTTQVRELYNALKDRAGGITYVNRTGAPFTDQFGDQTSLSQRVRLPGRSLADGCANCLDGAVLFASLLAHLDLNPVILFLPDHVLVGWKTAKGPAGELKFLEITDVADKKNFEQACKNGEARYELVKDRVKEADDGELTNPLDFAIMVDVRAAQQKRKLGILKL